MIFLYVNTCCECCVVVTHQARGSCFVVLVLMLFFPFAYLLFFFPPLPIISNLWFYELTLTVFHVQSDIFPCQFCNKWSTFEHWMPFLE